MAWHQRCRHMGHRGVGFGISLAPDRGNLRTSPTSREAMRTEAFHFDLPPDRIALRPASPRDAARLLVVRPGAGGGGGGFECEDRFVRDLPDLLRAGDQLVVNDTKVIPAQLYGRRLGSPVEPRIEATLIRRLDG